MERKLTKRIQVGPVAVGGGAPVSIQSMLNTRTTDVGGSLAQIRALAAAGCEIARLAVPDMEAAEAFGDICAASPLPLVADIHFDYRLAIRAAENGAAKIRINPGNIGGEDRVRAVVEACGARGIPIRVGVSRGFWKSTAAPRRRRWSKVRLGISRCWKSTISTTSACR